jgi:beta-hydroxylase
MRFRWAQGVNHFFGKMLTAAMNLPNAGAGRAAGAGMLSTILRGIGRCRRRLRSWNMAAYNAAVVASVAAFALLLYVL